MMSPCRDDGIISSGSADIHFPILQTSAADLALPSAAPFSPYIFMFVSDTDQVFFHAENVIVTQPEQATARPEHC